MAVGHSRSRRCVSFELDGLGSGTGDVWSTVRDLARWDTALASGWLLSDAAGAAMCSAQTTLGVADYGIDVEGYGYGLFDGTL